MEPITHALSGAVIGYALPGKRRWWLPAWAALVAASPDMDVFFTRTPLQYIEYHRGITHSFVGGLGLALLLALIPWLMNRWRVPKVPDDSPPFGWPLPLAWLTAYLLNSASHFFGLHGIRTERRSFCRSATTGYV